MTDGSNNLNNLSDLSDLSDISDISYLAAKDFFHQQKFHQAEDVMLKLFERGTANIDHFVLMAKIKACRGLYVEQTNFLNQALAIDSTSPELFIMMAFAQLNLCQFNEACHYADLAKKNKRNTAETLSLLGKIYHDLGLYTQSAQAYKKAIQLSLHDHQLLHNYGVALTLTGQINASIDAFQQSIKLNPDFGLAYSALSKVRKASGNDNNIEQLKKLVTRERNPWTGINLCHGLAKELDDLKQYQDAFNVLAKGKKRLSTACPHNPNSGATHINILVALYEQKANEIKSSTDTNSTCGANTNKNKAAPIFVTGMPRTGTTIVERILTNSPEVITVGEREQFGILLKQQCKKSYSGLVDAKVLAENWDTIDFNKLGDNYINSVKYLTHSHAKFVDKLPLNILLAGVILRALPQAKIICLVRDPLDTVIGNYRQVFEQASGSYAHTLELYALANYVYEFRLLVSSLQQQFPERFMAINYEAIVDDPLASGKKIFDFCQLSWKDNYIDIHKNKAAIGTASAAQVQIPIHKNSLKQSENYMFCLAHIKTLFQQT